MEKDMKPEEPPKRDASPKRLKKIEPRPPIPNAEIVKWRYSHTRLPECWICKRTADIEVSETADFWECKPKCLEGEKPAPRFLGKDITTKLYDYRNALLGTKIGILDVFPKICESPRVHESRNGKYNWDGAYQIVLKKAFTVAADVQWLLGAGFRIVTRLSSHSMLIFDGRQTKSDMICDGAFPAERSLALLDPGRIWFHFENDNPTRRPLPELLKLFSEYCVAAGIFVSGGRSIEIPMGDEYALKNSKELSDIVTAEYAKMEAKEKFVGCL